MNEPQSGDRPSPERAPEEEPDIRGTLFFSVVFLMLIFGFWGVAYLMLLNR
ncbi:MAG: cytochrome c oxidase subunit 2A [Thermoanaerobaculia bacterium]